MDHIWDIVSALSQAAKSSAKSSAYDVDTQQKIR